MKSLAAFSLLFLVVSRAGLAQHAESGQPSASAGQDAPRSEIARWLDLQTVNLAARYRYVEASSGIASDEVQYGCAVRARFKIDGGARFTVNIGVATGRAVTSGWNGTGIGGGELSNALSVKQLYATAVLRDGLNIDYGGLSAVRGETTEVTNLDNDSYLVGGRLSVKRPDRLWLDEVTVSLAYMGDPLTPSVFSRLHRLSEINYQQYLVDKSVVKGIALSAGYDRHLGIGTVRTGVAARATRLRVIDVARFEQYTRLGAAGGSGFGVYGEKTFFARLLLSGGFADIDAGNQILNGDRYSRGKRLYTIDTLKVTSDLSVSVYFTHALATEFAIANRRRAEVVVSYGAVRAVRGAMGLE